MLSTNPSEGGLSIKAGAADSVKKQAESLNAVNSKANLGGLDQAISNIAADAVVQYYVEEQAKDMGYAMDAAAKYERMAYRLDQAKRLNLETLATDTGESFRQSGIGLKPYVSGASISNWDVAGDRAAALQLERTRAGVALAAGGPTTLIALAVASPALATTAGFGSITGMTVNGGFNVASQQYKYGEIKYPGELAINVGFGALEGYFGIFGGIGWNATVGAGSNVGSALANKWYYKNDVDHQYNLLQEATKGAVFGAGGKKLDDKFITPFIQKHFPPK